MNQRNSFFKLQVILIVAFFTAMFVNFAFSPLRESIDNNISAFLKEIDFGIADQFDEVEILNRNGIQIFRNILLFGIEEYVIFFICLYASGSFFISDAYLAAFIIYVILAGYVFLFLQSFAGHINLKVNRLLPSVHARPIVLIFNAFLIDNIVGYLIKLAIFILGKIFAFKWIALTLTAIFSKIWGGVVWLAAHSGTVGSILLVAAGIALAFLAYFFLFAPLIWMFLRFAFYYLVFFILLAGIAATRYILGWSLSLPAFLSNAYGLLIFFLIYTLVWKLFEYPIIVNVVEFFNMDTDIVEYFYSIGHIFDRDDESF